MSLLNIFGSNNIKFIKKNLECTIGMFITSNAINICQGTLKKETYDQIRKIQLWEYLIYIYKNNKGVDQIFSGLKTKPIFIK